MLICTSSALFEAQPDATVLDIPSDISYEQLLLAVEFIYTDFMRVPAAKASAMLPTADKCVLCEEQISVFLSRRILLISCRFQLPKFSALLKKCASNDQTPSAEADQLIPHMAELLEFGRYGDVVFYFPRKSQKLRAHKAVLAARYG